MFDSELLQIFKQIHSTSEGHHFHENDILTNGKTVGELKLQLKTLSDDNLIVQKLITNAGEPYLLMRVATLMECPYIGRWIKASDQIQDGT